MKRFLNYSLLTLSSLFIITILITTVAANPISSTLDMLSRNAEDAESAINNSLFARSILLYPSQLFNATTGKTYFPEIDAYIAETGDIIVGSDSIGNVDHASSQISLLTDYCNSTRRDFAYFILPTKPEYDQELIDVGIDCYRNKTADLYAMSLSEYGIPFLDLREKFRSEDDYYSFFYNTDNHWTADAAIIAAREIACYLNSSLSIGLNEDALADQNMIRTVLPSCWVGETGRKALGAFGEKDDFIIIKPNYETSFSYYSAPHDLHLEGCFDILTYDPILELDGIYGTGSTYYYYYLRDNRTPVEIINNSEQNGNILIVKDSFSNTVAPFIALTAHRVVLWDMRSDSNLIGYLDNHPEIDTVIIAYNIGFLTTSYMNQFFED